MRSSRPSWLKRSRIWASTPKRPIPFVHNMVSDASKKRPTETRNMPVDITLPDLGENISEGGVLEIRVKPGDAVKASDIVVVIEAEKSTVEVPAGVDGKITEVVVQNGQKVNSGVVLARAEAGEGAKPTAKP